MPTQEPIFYFNVKVAGWEAGSVFADFCRKNSIEAKPSLNGHDPVKSNRTPAKTRKTKAYLSRKQVLDVKAFLDKNPSLTSPEVIARLNLPVAKTYIYNIRTGKHHHLRKSN